MLKKLIETELKKLIVLLTVVLEMFENYNQSLKTKKKI